MIEFERHSDCTLCSLHESAKNPGIPTRPFYPILEINTDRAILFVGQSPGYNEDNKGQSFIGYTGKLLESFCLASDLESYADIYFSNSCRCKPPQGADESQSCMRSCRPYLQEDLDKLYEHYKEVIIFNLGAKAVYSTMHITSLNEALKKQAQKTEVFTQKPRVFSTFHPAILHSTRKPGLVRAVEAHFSLVLRYLQGQFIPNELKIEPELGVDVPDTLPDEVAVDIETYGILSGWEQTVFHPIKSKMIDKVDYKYQVVTVSFAWEDNNGKIRTAVYIYNWKKHRKKIVLWFKRISEQKKTCLGQNIKFDLLYLYLSGNPELSYWIDPRRLRLDDTLILSFLLYEQQPEKGLKELSTLFGITDYSGLRVTGKSGTAKSNRDKDLHYYNCLDAAATLVLAKELRRRIEERFGKNSYKLSDTCAWMRNTVLWDTFFLEKNGSSFNVKKLVKYHNEEKRKCNDLLESAWDNFGIKLAGKKSDAPLRQLMLDCVDEAGLMGDPRVEWSKKTGKISIGVENVNLIKSILSVGRNADIISNFQEYKERSKIISTYTGPLLKKPRQGIVTRCHGGRIGTVFPNWYPVPLYADRGGGRDDKAGGQIQGRFSCKKPARQTEPPRIRRCLCSRWPNGKVVEYDINQDHIRMGALLSGDPHLLGAYQEAGISVHAQTALTIFPDLDPVDFKKNHPTKYKLGKTLNFLVLFRGGATAFQSTALQDEGIEVELDFCYDAIRKWDEKHHVYRAWQERMIALAAEQGYIELPTGWSRTFGIGHTNVDAQGGEVCNFLHQCPCAQVMHSIQQKIQLEFLRRHLRSRICLEIHDAIYIDTHPAEDEIRHEIAHEALTHPPLLPVFENWVGRTIPWQYERKEYENEI